MFVVASAALLILSNTDAAHVAELVTRHTPLPEFRFIGVAEGFDVFRVVLAGALNATGVLLFVTAVTYGGASNVAPYDYTIPLWGVALEGLMPFRGPVAETELPLGLAIASGVAIFSGAVWFSRARRT